jgi:uncharacterized protein YuzE
MQNNESLDDDDDNLPTPEEIQQVEELLVDTAELKKVAARTLLRATHIIDSNPNDTDVAYLLLHEATIMMQIVHRIESFFQDDSGK